jgi:hypothetical protein
MGVSSCLPWKIFADKLYLLVINTHQNIMKILKSQTMKTLSKAFIATICLFCLLYSGLLLAQLPDAISIEPPDATAYDEITLTLDTRLSCPNGDLFDADSVMMHSGVTINGAFWQNIIEYDSLAANRQQPKLAYQGDSLWSITFVPAEFYGIEEGTPVEAINCVFNAGSWGAGEGKDYSTQGECIDFIIPLFVPELPEIYFSIVMSKAIDYGVFDPDTDEVFLEIEGYDPFLLELSLQEIWITYINEGLVSGNELSFAFSINQVQDEEISRTLIVQDGVFGYHCWWNDDPYINYSGAISVSPENPSYSEEITITLNTLGSCPSNSLLYADSIMMHSGLTISDNFWQYIVPFDSYAANGQ